MNDHILHVFKGLKLLSLLLLDLDLLLLLVPPSMRFFILKDCVRMSTLNFSVLFLLTLFMRILRSTSFMSMPMRLSASLLNSCKNFLSFLR